MSSKSKTEATKAEVEEEGTRKNVEVEKLRTEQANEQIAKQRVAGMTASAAAVSSAFQPPV